MDKGLVLVNTGNGKGKTTAALGLALRAVGNGQKVLILQFIKGAWKYGELSALERLSPDVEVHPLGNGFVRHNKKDGGQKEFQQHQEKARAAWETVKNEVMSDQWDLVILDEVNYAVDFGLLQVEDVVDLIKSRPERLNLVLTGRNARSEVIAIADTVTEMKPIKHAFEKGVRARRGIEF